MSRNPAPTPPFRVAVAGNPNSGKTSLFNALTGATARTGNHPGITVEERRGTASLPLSGHVEFIDMPGSYSLNARTPDEEVAIDILLGRRGRHSPDAVLVVLDAATLERSLYTLMQVMEFNLPVIAVVNMIDTARDEGFDINFDHLREVFGIPFVGTVARRRQGVELLKKEVDELLQNLGAWRTPQWFWTPSPALEAELEGLAAQAVDEVRFDLPEGGARAYALWLLASLNRDSTLKVRPALREAVLASRGRLRDEGLDLDDATILPRWEAIDVLAPRLIRREEGNGASTERIDGVLTHPVWGSAVFLAVMALIFQALFAWSEPMVSGIEGGFDALGGWLVANLPAGLWRDLLTEGVLAGVGGILVFLPQILFLFFFLTLLEGSGYLSRSAFLVHRLMRKIGLHGHAFVPLVSGFACAVPAIMATRTIESRRDRLLTMMVLPLISCSARLPVYTMIIALLFPAEMTFGFFRAGTLVLLGAYVLSTLLALLAAALLSRTVLRGEPKPLLIELPPYRVPDLRTVLLTLRDKAVAFLSTAGTIILVATVVLWVLLSFPRIESDDSVDPRTAAAEQLRGSYAGQLGEAFEPIIAPLGFDWKIGIGLIGSFAAREVFVSTMGVVYGVGETEAGDHSLRTAMERDVRNDGRKLWTPMTGVSLMAFFMVAMQCMSTLAVTKRESGSWAWTGFMLLYLSGSAWVFSFMVYRIGLAMGYT